MQVDMSPEVLYFNVWNKLSKSEKSDYYAVEVSCSNCKTPRSLFILRGIRLERILKRYVVVCGSCDCVVNISEISDNKEPLSILPGNIA